MNVETLITLPVSTGKSLTRYMNYMIRSVSRYNSSLELKLVTAPSLFTDRGSRARAK